MKSKKHYLFPSDYMADPAAHVFNGKLYIYPSHDWEAGAEEDDDGGHFQMKDYHALLLEDPENGEATDLGVIFDVKDVPWAEKQLWDSDVVEKNGKYYYVFSGKGYDGVFRLARKVVPSTPILVDFGADSSNGGSHLLQVLHLSQASMVMKMDSQIWVLLRLVRTNSLHSPMLLLCQAS